jgi:hypothetical protein
VPTPCEFVGGIHADAEVDQCDQGGHKGPCYLVLVWDPGKGYEVTSVRHSFHPTYLAHIGIGFPSI